MMERQGGEYPSPNVWPHHGEVWDSRDPEQAAGCVPIHPTSPGPCHAEGQRIPSTWVSFQVVIRLFSSSIWDTWSSSICQRKKAWGERGGHMGSAWSGQGPQGQDG